MNVDKKLELYLDQRQAERRREAMRRMLDDLNEQRRDQDIILDGRALAKALGEQDPGPQPKQTSLDVALTLAGRPPKNTP